MRKKVLVVDDDPDVARTLVNALQPDYDLEVCGSGEEAIDRLKEIPDFAVILSDHRMPGISGIEFLEFCKEKYPESVRVIVSGHIDLAEMEEAVNMAQIQKVILKPFKRTYLRLRVSECAQLHDLMLEKNRLQRLSLTDPITGLANHRRFQQQLRIDLDRSNRHKRPVSLLMIDVDRFKKFNDKLGHPEGDKLLAGLAKMLLEKVRNIDLVCRYGGEEFTVILPDTASQDAFEVAERLRKYIELNPYIGTSGKPSKITVSLGVASYPDQATGAESLIQAADQAMYQAKRQGRNQTVVAK